MYSLAQALTPPFSKKRSCGARSRIGGVNHEHYTITVKGWKIQFSGKFSFLENAHFQGVPLRRKINLNMYIMYHFYVLAVRSIQ